LALVTAATGKLWLAAEIVSSDDHATDTVVKKQLYEELKLPRLWMVDPRYDNVELYSAGPYGMVLQGILGGNEVLTEKLLPDFQISITELFKPASL
jgi:Uma2 family endonuclease